MAAVNASVASFAVIPYSLGIACILHSLFNSLVNIFVHAFPGGCCPFFNNGFISLWYGQVDAVILLIYKLILVFHLVELFFVFGIRCPLPFSCLMVYNRFYSLGGFGKSTALSASLKPIH